MAKEKEGKCCESDCSCKMIFGVLVLLLGLAWFGNDMGWWSVNVPWLPLIAILFGLKILMHGMCKKCK